MSSFLKSLMRRVRPGAGGASGRVAKDRLQLMISQQRGTIDQRNINAIRGDLLRLVGVSSCAAHYYVVCIPFPLFLLLSFFPPLLLPFLFPFCFCCLRFPFLLSPCLCPSIACVYVQLCVFCLYICIYVYVYVL